MQNLPGIDCLNTGLGDMEIRWNPDDAIQLERARRIITDMLRRGYALFLKCADGKMVRVTNFDPKDNTYTIGDGPEPVYIDAEAVTEHLPSPGVPVDAKQAIERYQSIEKSFADAPVAQPKRGRKVPANKVVATAVGRSAGG